MGLKLVTPPADYPVSLAEAKAHCNVDFDDDDSLLTSFIKVATEHLDGYGAELNAFCLKEQTWDFYRDRFPECRNGMRIPLRPVIEIDSVNYFTDADTEVELAASAYEVDTNSRWAWVMPGSSGWPVTPCNLVNAVRVRFIAGHADTEDSPPVTTVPEGIRAAILMMVRDLYDNRGDVVTGTIVNRTDTIERLISPYRVITI